VVRAGTGAVPEQFVPVLGRLQSESRRYFASDDLAFEPVAVFDRPFSEVLQVRVVSGVRRPDAFVKRVKLREPVSVWRTELRRRLTQEFDTCLRVHEALSGCAGLAAVRPIACFADDFIIVTEQVPGRTLTAILEDRADWYPSTATVEELSDALERVGSWLRAFQAALPQAGTIAVADVRDYLAQRLNAIVASPGGGFSEADKDAVLTYFDRTAATIPANDWRRATIHADFCPANVLIEGREVAVIDFDRAAVGCQYLDVARMFTQLESLQAKPKFRPETVRALQSALLRGFDPGFDPAQPLFQLMVLQHTVCQFKKVAQRRTQPAARAWVWYLRRRYRNWLRSLASTAGSRPFVTDDSLDRD
jgi:Ser/Thr protein kinase RdoA (MazF antagonist)